MEALQPADGAAAQVGRGSGVRSRGKPAGTATPACLLSLDCPADGPRLPASRPLQLLAAAGAAGAPLDASLALVKAACHPGVEDLQELYYTLGEQPPPEPDWAEYGSLDEEGFFWAMRQREEEHSDALWESVHHIVAQAAFHNDWEDCHLDLRWQRAQVRRLMRRWHAGCRQRSGSQRARPACPSSTAAAVPAAGRCGPPPTFAPALLQAMPVGAPLAGAAPHLPLFALGPCSELVCSEDYWAAAPERVFEDDAGSSKDASNYL